MKNNELDALFTGLTGTADNKQEVSSPKEQTTTKAKKSSAGKDRLRQKTLEQARNQQRFCSIIDSDVLKKIRIIATREGHQIKDVTRGIKSRMSSRPPSSRPSTSTSASMGS